MNRLSIFAASLALFFVLACGAQEETAEPVVETVSEGQRLLDEGSYEEAQAYYESEIAAAPEDAEQHFLAGQAAAMGANYDAAIAHITKAMELAPDTAGHYDWLGRIYGAQARIGGLGLRIKLAPLIKENFEKAAELDPENTETQFFLGTFYVVAPPNLGGSREKGAAIAEALLQSDPLSGHRLMAQLHAIKKEGDAAIAEYKEAITLAPEDPQSYADLGAFLTVSGNFEPANENFAKALELNADHQASLLGLGQLGSKSPDHTDAGIEALVKLVGLEMNIQSPSMADAWVLLGGLYQKKKETDKAIEAYEGAVAAGHLTAHKAVTALKAEQEAAEEAATVEAPSVTDESSTGSQEVESMETAPAAGEALTDSQEAEPTATSPSEESAEAPEPEATEATEAEAVE